MYFKRARCLNLRGIQSSRKAKPAKPSQPTLPLAEQDGESDDSEELIPDRNNDPPSEAESDETRYYSSDEVDLVFDEKDWVYYTEDQKLCANTASFSMPRYMDGAPVDATVPLGMSSRQGGTGQTYRKTTSF